MYDPNVGRWLSEDPIGFAGGDANLYRYVGSSPTNYTDPSGLSKKGAGSGSVVPTKTLEDCTEDRIGYYVGVFADYDDDWNAGSAMDLQGHAAIGFARGYGNGVTSVDGVYGFYPSDVVRDDSGKKFKVGRVYRVSPENYLRMQAEALRRQKNPGKYDQTKQNCTTFVKDVGEKGGLLDGVRPRPLSPYENYGDFGKTTKPTYVPGALGDFLKGDHRTDSHFYP